MDEGLISLSNAGHFDMTVGVDETRHDDLPAGVEGGRAAGLGLDVAAATDMNDAPTPYERGFRLRLIGLKRQYPGIHDRQVATPFVRVFGATPGLL